MITQPPARLPVIGEDRLHHSVESFRVVHLSAVGQLMDHNIIQDFLRRQDQPPVKVQIAFVAAAPPPRFLLTDRDPPVGYAHEPGVIGCLACEDVSCDGNISGAVFVRQWRLLRGRMVFPLFFESRGLS